MEKLDESQRLAATTDARRVLVIAGPGSGKTGVLASRIAFLVEKGVAPEKILAITFTTKAAIEMAKRVSQLTGLNPAPLNIATFHGFCLKYLKQRLPAFALYAREDALMALNSLGAKDPEAEAKRISAYKNLVQDDAPEFYNAYKERLKEENALDLDDLVMEATRVLKENPGDLNSFDHIMVDEYQDINGVQEGFVRGFADSGAALFAIGDPDQSIYSFRGASIECFLGFEKTYPGSSIVRLSKNYRSSKAVVDVSRALINRASKMPANEASHAAEGGSVEIVACCDEKAEAEFIVKEIERKMGGLRNLSATASHGTESFSDFAVFFRTRKQADAIVDAFTRSSIPYNIAVSAGLGLKTFMEGLNAREIKPGEAIAGFIKRKGKELSVDANVIQTLASIAEAYAEMDGAEALSMLLEYMRLMDEEFPVVVKADRVNLMTLHASKGLEFPVVFIAGAEDGLIPLRLKGRPTDIDEERRLLYVGITRAKDSVYILSAGKRRLWADFLDQTVSPFLKDIPEHLAGRRVVEKKAFKKRPSQKGLFE